MALIFYKTPEDGTLILGAREALIYPFTSVPSWVDLRLGVYLSLTNALEVDNQTLLTESRPWITFPDRFFIGFKYNNDNFPGTADTVFIGLTNEKTGSHASPSKIDPSSGGTATTGTAYWRAYLSGESVATRYINNTGVVTDGSAPLTTPIGSGIFLRQTGTGYAALNMVRLTRATTTSDIKVNIEGGASINADYTDTPTIERIRSFLVSSTFVQHATGVPLAFQPTAVYFYWPYIDSRLRIHAIVLEKFA